MPLEFGVGAPDVVEVIPSTPTVTYAPRVSELLVIPVAGPTGPQGLPGTPGGNGYVHTQSAPAATWIIDHGLNRKVHVTLFDVAETVVFADVAHGSINQTTITFADPKTGSAFIS